MNLSVDENVVTGGSTEPNHVFPLGATVPVHYFNVHSDFIVNVTTANIENHLYSQFHFQLLSVTIIS